MPRIETYTGTRIWDVDAEKFLRVLLHEKRIGVLTLHIGQGRVGLLEWTPKDEANGKHAGANQRASSHVLVPASGLLDGPPPKAT